MDETQFAYHFKQMFPDLYKTRQLELRESGKAFKKEFFQTDEGKKIIADKIIEIDEDLKILKEHLRSVNKNAATADDSTDWLYELMVEDQAKDIKTLERKKWQLNKALDTKEGWRVVGEPEEVDIEKVKEIPISNLFTAEPMAMGNNRKKFLCPIHNEVTPSFVWYEENNSWYCFGACQTGGDIIALYMAINECEFYEAIKALQ